MQMSQDISVEHYDSVYRSLIDDAINKNVTECDVDSEKSSDKYDLDEDEQYHETETDLPNIHPSTDSVRLRPSQYQGLPSTIFIDYASNIGLKRQDSCELISIKGKKLLYNCQWERHCLRTTFMDNGFTKSEANWIISWSEHLEPDDVKELSCIQKTNHFPASWCLGRKDRLVRTLNEMKRKFRNQEYNFHPETFVLPKDNDILQRKITDSATIEINSLPLLKNDKSNTNNIWIVKPVASSCGRGIKVKTSEQLSDYLLTKKSKNTKLLVQKYISNPYLINGNKFDLRIYVLVTGVDPLRIYIYREGLTRISTSKYSLKSRDLKNNFAHLTNYSINKKSEKFKASSNIRDNTNSHKLKTQTIPNEKNNQSNNIKINNTSNANTDINTVITDDSSLDSKLNTEMETDTFKWSLTAFKKWLSEKISHERTISVFDKIHDICIKTMIAAEGEIVKNLQKSITYRTNCFELFGCDILLDEQLEPHLLEVNVSPSLMGSSELDKYIKGMLVADTLHIVGLYPNDRAMIKQYTNNNQTTNPFNFPIYSNFLENQDLWRKQPSIHNVDFQVLANNINCPWSMLLMIDDEIQRSLSTQYDCVHPHKKTVEHYNSLYRLPRFFDHVIAYWILHNRSTGELRSMIPNIFLFKTSQYQSLPHDLLSNHNLTLSSKSLSNSSGNIFNSNNSNISNSSNSSSIRKSDIRNIKSRGSSRCSSRSTSVRLYDSDPLCNPNEYSSSQKQYTSPSSLRIKQSQTQTLTQSCKPPLRMTPHKTDINPRPSTTGTYIGRRSISALLQNKLSLPVRTSATDIDCNNQRSSSARERRNIIKDIIQHQTRDKHSYSSSSISSSSNNINVSPRATTNTNIVSNINTKSNDSISSLDASNSHAINNNNNNSMFPVSIKQLLLYVNK